MTTLIGIKALKGTPGIVLASDLQASHEEWARQGDEAYRIQTKAQAQKITVDEKRTLAFCMAGVADRAYEQFKLDFCKGHVNFQAAMLGRHFKELYELNLERMGGAVWNNGLQNGLLVATRFGTPTLYTCFPLGKTEQRYWTALGSGSDHANRYLRENLPTFEKNLSLADAVHHAHTALKHAATDIHTGGIDLCVITEQNIAEWGAKIKGRIDSAEQEVLQEILTSVK